MRVETIKILILRYGKKPGILMPGFFITCGRPYYLQKELQYSLELAFYLFKIGYTESCNFRDFLIGFSFFAHFFNAVHPKILNTARWSLPTNTSLNAHAPPYALCGHGSCAFYFMPD